MCIYKGVYLSDFWGEGHQAGIKNIQVTLLEPKGFAGCFFPQILSVPKNIFKDIFSDYFPALLSKVCLLIFFSQLSTLTLIDVIT